MTKEQMLKRLHSMQDCDFRYSTDHVEDLARDNRKALETIAEILTQMLNDED